MASSLPTFSSSLEDKKGKNRLKINLKGKGQGLPPSNLYRSNLSPSLPRVNIEDVLLTDVEQSSDEMDDQEFSTKEINDVTSILEMEGGYEETVDKVGKYKTKNKVAVYSVSKEDYSLRPSNNDVCELTDVEEFATSDGEYHDHREIYEDPDFLNKFHEGREIIAITDEMKGHSLPSPAITPEPERQGLRRRKPVKSAKDHSNKQGNPNKSYKHASHLTPNMGVQLYSTLTDTELLVSNSESDLDIVEDKRRSKNLPIDGWVTDIEDLAASSADEYIKNVKNIKGSNSVNDFFYLGDSGSDDEFRYQAIIGRKFKNTPKKKGYNKVISPKQGARGTVDDWQQNNTEKIKSGLPCTNFIGEKLLHSRKPAEERKKNLNMAPNIGNFHTNHNTILTQQSQIKSIKRNEQIKVSSQCISLKEIPKPKVLKSHQYFIDEAENTEVESFESEGEDLPNYECKQQSKRFSVPSNSKLYSQNSQNTSTRNISSAFATVNINDNISRNPSPALSLPENSVVHLNEKIKEYKGLQVVGDLPDPLTDTEEIVLSGGLKKDMKAKKKLTKTLNVVAPEIGVTDTEDLEMSDNERAKSTIHLQYQTDADYALLTDTDEFSVADDTEDELNDYISPSVATPEHFRFIRSNTLTSDKEGVTPYFTSETENNFFSDQGIPIIQTISPSPTFQHTDIEDMVASADEEICSRNETPNVGEPKLAFEDHYSVIHMKNTRAFQLEGEETLHVKEITDLQDPVTDVEDIYTQDENQFFFHLKKMNPGNNNHEDNSLLCKRTKKDGQSKLDRSVLQSPTGDTTQKNYAFMKEAEIKDKIDDKQAKGSFEQRDIVNCLRKINQSSGADVGKQHESPPPFRLDQTNTESIFVDIMNPNNILHEQSNITIVESDRGFDESTKNNVPRITLIRDLSSEPAKFPNLPRNALSNIEMSLHSYLFNDEKSETINDDTSSTGAERRSRKNNDMEIESNSSTELQMGDTMPWSKLDVDSSLSNEEPIPYVTTPSLHRRGVGGSQRLSQEERPSLREVSHLFCDSMEDNEYDDYIVTEPSEKIPLTQSKVKFTEVCDSEGNLCKETVTFQEIEEANNDVLTICSQDIINNDHKDTVKNEGESQNAEHKVSLGEMGDSPKKWDEGTSVFNYKGISKEYLQAFDSLTQEGYQSTECGFEGISDSTPPKPSPRFPLKETSIDKTTDLVVEDQDYAAKKMFWETVSSTDMIKSQKQEPHVPVPRPRLSLSSSTSKPGEPDEGDWKMGYSDVSTLSETSEIDYEPKHTSIPTTEKTVVPELTKECTISQEIDNGSEIEYLQKMKDHLEYDNIGFNEDDEDVASLKKLTETKRRVFERSISLPAENIGDTSISSVRVKKRIFEAQIKKEMVVEQLMSQPEEVSSPEHKALWQKEPLVTDSEEMISRQIHSHIFSHELEDQGELSLPEDKGILASQDQNVYMIPTHDSKDVIDQTYIESLQLKEDITTMKTKEEILHYVDDKDKSLSLSSTVAEVFQYKNGARTKPSDSLEVHIDKSELEGTEKDKDIDDFIGIEDTGDEASKHFSQDAKTQMHISESKLKHGSRTSSPGESEDTFSESDVTPEDTRFKEQDVQEWGPSEKDVEQESYPVKDGEKKICTPEEHVPNIVWEVPVQQGVDNIQEEISHSIESEYSTCSKKISEVGEKVDELTEEDARKIANYVVENIEAEIAMRSVLECASETVPPESGDYVQDLKKSFEQDNYENELSLTKKVPQQMKFVRTDTTTSSMEITDEDLRSSGVETDISPLESQACKLIQHLDDTSESDSTKEFDNQDLENQDSFSEDVVEKTLAEVRESLEAVKEELIEEKKKKKDSITKESPSEFEFTVLAQGTRISESIQESHSEDSGIFASIKTKLGEVDYQSSENEISTRQFLSEIESKKDTTVKSESDKYIVTSKVKEDVKTLDSKEDVIIAAESTVVTQESSIIQEKNQGLAILSDEQQASMQSKHEEATIISKSGVQRKILDEESKELENRSKEIYDVNNQFTITEGQEYFSRIKQKEEGKVIDTKSKVSSSKEESEHKSKDFISVTKTSTEKSHISTTSTLESKEHSKSVYEVTSVFEIDPESFEQMKAIGSLQSENISEKIVKKDVHRTYSTDSQKSSLEEDSIGKKTSDESQMCDKSSISGQKSTGETTVLKTSDLKSVTDTEHYSSSGESYYQSFEQTSESARTPSRPCSSDVEGLIAHIGVITGSSEYESAMSHETSGQSTSMTSHEFHTAKSSLSSRASMKSLDSESSGNLASVEISSEASETLVPSALELEKDMETFPTQTDEESNLYHPEAQEIQMSRSHIRGKTFSESVSFEISADDMSEDESDEQCNVETEVSKKMKRSFEMTFQPEPRPIGSESTFSEITSQDDKRESSLEDVGSLIMLSDSSGLKTVISKLDSEGFDDSMASDQLCSSLSGPSVQHDFKDSKELQEKFAGEIRQESTSTQYSSQMGTVDSVTLSTSTVNEFGQQSVSTQITSQSEDKSKTSEQSNGPTQVDYNVEYDEDSVDVDTKKRPGHRRNGSMTIKTPMTPVLSKEIKKPDDIIEDSAETDRYVESILIHEEEQLFGGKDAYEAGKSGEEAYQIEVDQVLHQDFREETVFDDICSLGEKRETEMPIDLDTSFQIDIEQGLITKGFSDDRPDSELIELMKQFSSDAASEDPIERPKSPEPAEECELKDDTPEFSSEAQASITELEMEYCGAFSRANEYDCHISPIHEKTSVVHEGVEHNLVQEYELAETEIVVDEISSLERKKTGKDLADKKHELETLELIVKESKGKQVGSIDTSPGHIPDITITEHMTPVADKSFHFTDLENQEIVEDNDFKQTSSPQTPASISSKASSETETDQGCEYVLDDPAVSNFIEESDIQDEVDLGEISHTTEERTVFETKNDVKSDHDSMTDSPNSDSFEMLEKPDISEEFVIIEEIGKEAKEQDSEGKGVKIEGHITIRKATSKPDIPVPKSVTTKMTDIKYFSVGANEENVGAFAFEPGSPSSSIEQQSRAEPSEGSPPSGEENEYENEVEAGKKWMEMQFQGEHAVAVYGYDIEFERGPLEDIKEEDANDLESSSRIGSMGSQISHSIGSFGSVKESLSSTPDYDVLAGRKFFTRSGEHDDVSMSSLQEFERLEHLIAMESVKSRSLGSQDSLTSSSNSKKQGSRSGGDDVSLASLKEFEGLESACIAAESIEKKAKAEEESLLSEIEEGHESQASESESCLTISGRETNRGDSDEDDYEKRMFEIDEIIRQAQANVENFIDSSDRAPDLETLDSKVTDKTDSLGRADSVEDVSKVPDLDLDQPLYNVPFSSKDIQEHQWKELDEELFTSTDSLELKTQVSKSLATSQRTTSTDSLDTKTSQVLMATSPESLESFPYSKPTVIDVKTDDGKSSLLTSTDSLEMDVHIVTRIDSTDDEEPQNLAHDQSSSSGKEGDLSSSGKEDSVDGGAFSGTNRMPPPRAELMLGSTDSLEPTSSTATHATYQYETDSIMSSSFTSGDSNTMVSSTENIESAGGSGVWFEDGKPYVTEVIEPGDDDFSHIIHRTVEMPPEIRKVSFTGPEAEIALQEYIENFSPGEDMTETQETDDSGNVHITRIIQRRVVIRPDELGGNGSDLSGPQLDQFLRSLTKDGAKDTSVLGGDHNIQEEVKPQPNTSLASQEPPYSTETPFNTYVIQQTTSTHHATPHSEGGSSIRAESHSKDTSEKQLKGAQIVVRPPLKYDISMDDETECDPREHDWRFNLQSHLEGEEERHGQAKEHIPKESGAHMDVGTSKEKRGH